VCVIYLGAFRSKLERIDMCTNFSGWRADNFLIVVGYLYDGAMEQLFLVCLFGVDPAEFN